MYNQLLYFRGLWNVEDVEKKGKVVSGELEGDGRKEVKLEGEESERVKAVAEWNRERFGTCKGVVEGYLGKCGRVWVQMDGLFGFAM